jgi:hypothetical protein
MNEKWLFGKKALNKHNLWTSKYTADLGLDSCGAC